MNWKKITAITSSIIGLVVVGGYLSDAHNYYITREEADQEHLILAQAQREQKSWSELESIKHQISILHIQISRIVDRAESENRALTPSEENEITSLREELRYHNDRRNTILAKEV